MLPSYKLIVTSSGQGIDVPPQTPKANRRGNGVDRGTHGAVMIDHDGISNSISGWSRRLNISTMTIKTRLEFRTPIDAVGCDRLTSVVGVVRQP